MKKGRGKKGEILTENIVFILLNLVFLAIILLFLVSRMGAPAVLEESYAKRIALAIDAAQPGMLIEFEAKDLLKKKKSNIDVDNIVLITDNVVTVKLRTNGEYSYSFFNDVQVGEYFVGDNLVLTINPKGGIK
jgi:hypothetical protein